MPFVVFDSETDGLPMRGKSVLEQEPHVLEIAAVLLDDAGVEIDAYESFILPWPGYEVPQAMTKIHGITTEMLSGAPYYKDIVESLSLIFKRATASVAHNHDFDRTLLGFENARIGVEDFPWPSEGIDTVSEFQHVFGRRAKLIELYKHFLGKELQQKHRAMDDVRALIEVCKAGGLIP